VASSSPCYPDEHALVKKLSKIGPPCERVLAAGKLLFSESKMALMIPTQMAFGLMAALLNSYVSGVLVPQACGVASVGYFDTVLVSVAIVVSITSSIAIKLTGRKVVVMCVGALGFLLEGVILLTANDEQLSSTAWLVVIYAAQGVGRGVWESTNKAVIADFFPQDAAAAFANIIWSSALASTFGYFTFSKGAANVVWESSLCVALVVLGLACYLGAHWMCEMSKEANAGDFGEELALSKTTLEKDGGRL